METIKKIIESKGLKMSYIANEIGVNNNTMTNWNKRKAGSEPKISQFYKMSVVLNIDFCELYNRVYGGNIR